MDLRSKARMGLSQSTGSLSGSNAPPGVLQTLSGPVSDPSKLPKWNYNGSSTHQAPGYPGESQW